MDYKKISFFILLSVLCAGFGFAHSFEDSENSGIYKIYGKSSDTSSSLSVFGENAFGESIPVFGDYYYWPSNNQDYVIVGPVSEDVTSPVLEKYEVGKQIPENGGLCKPYFSSTNTFLENFEAGVQANLNPVPSALDTDGMQSYLKTHYYMKTLVFLKVTKGTETPQYFLPENSEGTYVYNNETYNTTPGTTQTQLETLGYNSVFTGHAPFFALNTSGENVQFNKQEVLNYCAGQQCTIEVIAVPIDGKCDMNTDGTLIQGTEFNKNSKSFTINSPINDDGTSIQTPINNINKDSLCKLKNNVFIPKFSTFLNKTTNKPMYFDKDCNSHEITKPTEENKYIKIKKDGKTNQKLINSTEIALHLPNLVKRQTKAEFQNTLNKAYNLMTDLTIENELTYNQIQNKTEVKIKLSNTEEKQNLVVYQIIPKTIASNLSNVKILSPENAQFFIKDNDPVIGWYFNESDGDEEVGYETEGNQSNPGYVVIIEDPILFNEGNLSINYRELGCRLDEVELFSIDNLTGSNVYSANPNKPYSICLFHQEYDLKQSGGSELKVGSFEEAGEYSTESDRYANKLKLDIKESGISWDLRIQEENPTGDYSCLGSINDEISSLFGDCSYNPANRIWIHLGEDLTPPTVDLAIPPVSHSLKITITTEDDIGGSGIKSLKYCVDSDNTCIPENENTNIVLDQITQEVSVSCSGSTGCTKYLRYEAEDNLGNLNEGSKELVLIDRGSSCQSDCSAKPKPNRFLSQCRNINGCEYYEYDENGNYVNGEYVAELCHLHTLGSYVEFNDTHDIMCPNGPFRETTFTTFKLAISSDCNQLISNIYPILIDGRTVNMHIYSCIE